MWYLVVPPIIVILSLFFLLWYLSRKGTDPVIAQKVLEGGKEEQLLFPGMRGFFLKVIEKSAQRFKVDLLRAHNTLNEFTQSVKKMRAKIEPKVSPEKNESPLVEAAPISTAPWFGQKSFSFGGMRKKQLESDEVSAKQPEEYRRDILRTPIFRKEKGSVKKDISLDQEKNVFVSRPTVSEIAVHPEIKKNPVGRTNHREENLIARIARDPKDFTAYEELGDHYLDIGNIKDAKECYRQVLKLSPVHRLVKIKIRRLEKLLTRGGE